MMLAVIDYCTARIEELTGKIGGLCQPYEHQIAQLDAVPGTGVITAQDVIAETGTAGRSSRPPPTWRPGRNGARRPPSPAASAREPAPAAAATATSGRPSARPPPAPAAPRPSPARNTGG